MKSILKVSAIGVIAMVLAGGGCPTLRYVDGDIDEFIDRIYQQDVVISRADTCQVSLCEEISASENKAYVAGYGDYLTYAEEWAGDTTFLNVLSYELSDASITEESDSSAPTFRALEALLPQQNAPGATKTPFDVQRVLCETDGSCPLNRGILVLDHHTPFQRLYTLSNVETHFFVLGTGQIESLASYLPYYNDLQEGLRTENIFFVGDASTPCPDILAGKCVSIDGEFSKTIEGVVTSYDSSSAIFAASLALFALYFPDQGLPLLSRILARCSEKLSHLNMCSRTIESRCVFGNVGCPTQNLVALYDKADDYDCAGSPCVNAETPYYSALVAKGNDSDLTQTQMTIIASAAISATLQERLTQISGNYVCSLDASSSFVGCASSFFPIGIVSGTDPRLYADWSEKVVLLGSSNEGTIISEALTKLVVTHTGYSSFVNDADTHHSILFVGTSLTDKGCGSLNNCITVNMSDLGGYTDVTEDEWLPVAVASLRAVQLFTLFPDASNVAVRDMLRDNLTCIVSFVCLAIEDNFAGEPFVAIIPKLKDIYEAPLFYPCTNGRACVNAETPYYSALIAKDSSATTKLSKTLINVWANDGATALPFSQLLPGGSAYICVVVSATENCSASSAPIAVNYSSANRDNNVLPGNYADKVIVMNLLSEGFINSQGDRLIITPATDVSELLTNVAEVAFSKISLRVGTTDPNTCTDINCVNVPLSNFDYADTIPNRYLLPVALAGLRAAQLFTLFPDAPNVVVRDVLKDNVTCIVSFVCFAITNKLAGSTPYSYDLTSYTLKDLYDNPSLYHCSASGPCVNAETPYYSALIARDSSAPTKLSKTLINVWANDGSLYWGVFSQLLPGGSGYICVVVSATENCSASSAPIAVNLSSANRGGNVLPPAYADKVIVMNLLDEGFINGQGDRLIITPATDVSDKLENVAKAAFSKISLRVGTSGTNTCSVVNCVNVPLSNFSDYADSDNKYLLPVALAGLRATQLFTMFPDAPNVVVRDMLKTTNCLLLLKCSAIGNSVNGRTPPWSFSLASYDLKVLYDNPSFYPCASNGRACVNAETPYYSALIARSNSGLTKTLINVFGNDGSLGDRFFQLLPNDSAYVCEIKSASENCSTSSAPIAVNDSFANRANLPSGYKDKVTVLGPGLLKDHFIASEGERFIITPATESTLSGISLRVGTGEAGNTCTGFNCVTVPLSNFADYKNVTKDKFLPLALVGLRAAQLFTLFPDAPNVVVRDMLKDDTTCIVSFVCLAITNKLAGITPYFFEFASYPLKDLYENPSLYHCSDSEPCVNAETPYYSALIARDSSATKMLTKILIHVFTRDDTSLGQRFFALLPGDSEYICTLTQDNACGDSTAPIAVNTLKTYRVDSLPSDYEDKVTVMNLLTDYWIDAQGDRFIITPATESTLIGITLRVGIGITDNTCVATDVNCVNIPLSNFDTYKNVTKDYLLPVALAGLRAAQLFTIFPNASNNTLVEMLLNKKADGTTDTKCIVLLQCLDITDSFTTSSSGEAGSTTGAPASAGSAGSASSGSSSSAGSSNSFIADIGSMTTYGKRQVFWSDGGLSVETRSHKIYRGGAHAMAMTYRSMMGTLDITTGWTSQSSALGMEQMFLRGSSLGVFGALRYDAGSYFGMRPYVGLVASWHSMLETPKSITIMTANEVHAHVGVDVDVKGMRFALEGRCGQHQRLIGYGALSSALAETSCSTHLKASVSF